MVNGAGLAMATMDIIKLAGGEPANFLDVGGGANAEQIKNAFRILMADKSVKAVLINIFGGILRCDVLAAGVIAAVKELGVPVPIVIRMEGTNVEQGKQMLEDSGLNFATADDMSEAARQSRRAAANRRQVMAVLIDKNTRLIVQGITGREGTFHAKQAAAYGTNVVGGVTPGQGRHDARGLAGVQHGRRCVKETGANASVIFVPPPGGADAIMEAADAGLPLAVCITEGIPTLDMLRVFGAIRGGKTRVIGPNCPGLITAGQAKAGIIPGQHLQGRPGRHRVEERHADLRGDPPAHEATGSARPPASASAAIR